MKSIYDIIKKQNGEKFAQTIRSNDSGILDVPNLAHITKYAGRDAMPLLPYLISLKDVKIEEVKSTKNPFDLLHQAGYDAEYADTLEKQNSIKKYFQSSEVLCTFNDSNRYQNYYIINAVKHGIDKIKRANFTHPRREDEYGTSVISIQILKDGGFVSIKNRYNHTVEHPDNTFDSNPDNIIFGLSAALKSHFNVDFSSGEISPPDGYLLIKKQIIKYNYEINGIYYGNGFYVHNGKITELNPGHQMMLDYFIFDTKSDSYEDGQRQVIQIDSKLQDCFNIVLKTELTGEKPRIAFNESKNKCIKIGDRTIIETNEGKIISANFEKSDTVGKNFLHCNDAMKNLEMPNADDLVFSENILANNGLMVGKLYHKYAMSLRKKHVNQK